MLGWVKLLIIFLVVVGIFASISIYLESSAMPSSVQRSYNKLKDAEAFEGARMRSPKITRSGDSS